MTSSKRGKPSLKASVIGIERAQQIFKQRGLTRQGVAETLGIDRSVVGKFLRGQTVWLQKFEEICDFLDLPWQEIAEGISTDPIVSTVPPLVQTVRDQIRDYLVQRCGTLRIPGMTHARNVQAVYTRLRLHQGIGEHTLIGDDELMGASLEKSVSAEEAVSTYAHLHILGLPGAGKTTFLKYLALQCIQGDFKPNLVPIFVALRDLSAQLLQQDLLTCICQTYGRTCGLEESSLRELFEQGSILLLLDGEDEIPMAQSQAIALTNFDLFYKNRVVITCRIAANRHLHEQFTQATIQQLTDNQIREFSSHWFEAQPERIEAFLKWLTFIQADFRKGVDLARTPLLLTLLCIVFESTGDRPEKRHQIYEMAFESILGDLNSSHLIPESSIIAAKTYQEKMALMKAIAKQAFDDGDKVFSASRDFFAQADIRLEDWGGMSALTICRELEATYGIITQNDWNRYRFSHLSFHEYFVALALMDQSQGNQAFNVSALLNDSQLFHPNWDEVYLFIAEMLPMSTLQSFLEQSKCKLMADLLQHPQALEQISVGAEVATGIIDLYQQNPHSPIQAQTVLESHRLEASITIRAFCSDYYYQFDPARRISRVFDLGYRFNHDLVLAHCFKCNLNDSQKQRLKVGQDFDFSDALIHLWTQKQLHTDNQQLDSTDQVRALFFDHVMDDSHPFSKDCIQAFKQHEPRIKQLAKLSKEHAILAKSALVAQVSSPDQEDLESMAYRFPTMAYQQQGTEQNADAEEVLEKYYHGCTLLCYCLASSTLSEVTRQQVLNGLFSADP